MDRKTTPPHAKWIEVNTSALRANFTVLKARLHPGCKVIAVVKANGYGHGLEIAARTFTDAGADLLVVTTLDEALRLRSAGITAPILLFAPSFPDEVDLLLEHDLTTTVCDEATIMALSHAAQAKGQKLRVHLKVDTGMGRVGCLWTDAALLAEVCHNDPGLHFEGIYTHFATAYQPGSALFRQQRDTFNALLESLAAVGHRPPLAHAANSAAFFSDPQTHLDAVRPGTVLYGQVPPGVSGGGIELRESWRFCCRILQVKELPAGWSVGYGAEYRCEKPTRVAVLPVGYTDGITVEPGSVFRGKRGLRRWVGENVLHKGQPYATIAGKKAPFLGRVAAQMVCVDVTYIPEAQAGTVAQVSARRTLVNADVPRIEVTDNG
jgi:alanine racemase